jgi:hypothetical protein
LSGWFIIIKFMNMITINKTLPDGQIKPIPHKGDDPERVGEIMTKEELHKFGLALLNVYLYKQKGKMISSNRKTSNDYPHIVVESPKDGLLYVWVKTEMFPTIPNIESIENHEEIINLANQFRAIPAFSGIRLSCISTKENSIPVYGGEYIAEFTRLKAF